MITLYHYTNEEGFYGIMNSRRIYEATRHQRYGTGVYFNSQQVGDFRVSKFSVAQDNYLSGAQKNLDEGYLDYCIEVDFPYNDVECVDEYRNVWVFRRNYCNLNHYDHHMYEV